MGPCTISGNSLPSETLSIGSTLILDWEGQKIRWTNRNTRNRWACAPQAGLSQAIEKSRMAISDANRAYFKDVGLSRVSRELVLRSTHYLINNDQRRQASEWVEEQLAMSQQEKRAAKMHETTRFYAAMLISILASIAALIAVWPVIARYFR
jgi:hypothetical protein